MKKYWMVSLCYFGLAVGLTKAEAAPVKIMPIGDSITHANSGHNSYRYNLWNKLKAGGYDVDFVGSMTKPNTGNYKINSGWDMNHEGHWGWRADAINGGMGTWASQTRPDIALLHIGSNDMNQNQSVSSTQQDIRNIVAKLRAANPRVTILLAKLIPWNRTDVNNRIKALNAGMPALATELNQSSSRVILVDQNTGFNARTGYDTYDGVHPSGSGEEKMATRWYNALKSVLGNGGSITPEPPVPPHAGGTIYEAERALLSGAKALGGYVDFINPIGDYMEWTINASKAGAHQVQIKYALTSGNRPLQIKVNGIVVQSSLSFPATGSFSKYQYVSFQIMLPVGVSKLRATAIGASGANIDSLSLKAL